MQIKSYLNLKYELNLEKEYINHIKREKKVIKKDNKKIKRINKVIKNIQIK